MLEPKTLNQRAMQRALQDSKLVIAKGPPGTGKTLLSVDYAMSQLLLDKSKSLVVTRPNIPTGRSLGAFPGFMEDKLGHWLMPIVNNAKSIVGGRTFDTLKRNGRFLMQPVETIRGQSFGNSIVLVDEAQNLTVDEIKSIATRIESDSQLVFTGDPGQTDLKASGLEWLVNIVQKYNIPDTSVIEFGLKDIVRSDIVGALAKAFHHEANQPADRKRNEF